LVRKINHQEIGWIILLLKSRIAAGPDGIQNIVLKDLLLPALKLIATVYNASKVHNYFPSQWNFVRIIMLPKPDKDHSSLLTVVKLLQNVAERLYFKLKELNINQTVPIQLQQRAGIDMNQ
jgi:hypothetical protein